MANLFKGNGPLGIKHRWWVLLFIILNIVSVVLIAPVLPHIQVAPENVSHYPLFSLPVLGDFYLTNTLIMLVLVDLLIVLLALGVRNAVRDNALSPKGIGAAMELAVEALYNLTETTAGKYTKTIFPWFATIVILVLVGNLAKLIPIGETFGVLHETHGEGHAIRELWAGGPVTLLNEKGDYGIIPYFRGIPTDLNFTLALALIAVVAIQVIGFKAQGPAYLLKFFNVTNLFKKPFFGVMDFLVGVLELISEFAKVLSFAFRLFGNMFAGAVLLFLISSFAVVNVFFPSFILMFEFFIGLIQAFVFGMLTMVFMAQATKGHGGEEHAEEAHAA